MSMSLSMLVRHTFKGYFSWQLSSLSMQVAHVTNIMYLTGCSAVPSPELLTKQKLSQQPFFWNPKFLKVKFFDWEPVLKWQKNKFIFDFLVPDKSNNGGGMLIKYFLLFRP